MSTRFKLISVIAVITGFALLITILLDIKSTYIELGTIKIELSQVKKSFEQYQSLAVKVNDIDTKFSQELTNAKAENNKLYSHVINGIGRLQINVDRATKATATSMDDAKTCELTGEARQNYYLLRDDIMTKDNMILALQAYIQAICLVN